MKNDETLPQGLREAVEALERALREGRLVSRELARVSKLMEQNIDPGRVRSSYADVERLLETARAIEARQVVKKKGSPWRPSRRVSV